MSVKQFQDFLQEKNINDISVIETDEITKTAQQAADVHGVDVSQIVKSILLKTGDKFSLFLVPGNVKIDFEKASEMTGEKDIRMATPDEVKEVTGYTIGGVPPFAHKTKITTYIYPGFPETGIVIPAAGSGNACFKIDINTLKGLINS